MSEWNRMVDGWPEIGDYVVICLFNKNVEVGYLQRGPSAGAYYFSEAYGDDFLVNAEGVTHWMPLPEPPAA